MNTGRGQKFWEAVDLNYYCIIIVHFCPLNIDFSCISALTFYGLIQC